jgi:hypothetical protein
MATFPTTVEFRTRGELTRKERLTLELPADGDRWKIGLTHNGKPLAIIDTPISDPATVEEILLVSDFDPDRPAGSRCTWNVKVSRGAGVVLPSRRLNG